MGKKAKVKFSQLGSTKGKSISEVLRMIKERTTKGAMIANNYVAMKNHTKGKYFFSDVGRAK